MLLRVLTTRVLFLPNSLVYFLVWCGFAGAFHIARQLRLGGLVWHRTVQFYTPLHNCTVCMIQYSTVHSVQWGLFWTVSPNRLQQIANPKIGGNECSKIHYNPPKNNKESCHSTTYPPQIPTVKVYLSILDKNLPHLAFTNLIFRIILGNPSSLDHHLNFLCPKSLKNSNWWSCFLASLPQIFCFPRFFSGAFLAPTLSLLWIVGWYCRHLSSHTDLWYCL